jgi:malonyl-CoA decarboxylase
LKAERHGGAADTCARPTCCTSRRCRSGDPVARFHLDNGARLERLNPRGNMSPKGLRQSFGLMVNYLYDLDKIEASHTKFRQGDVARSRSVAALI